MTDLPPFAGRIAAIARIRQHIADPINTPVPAFIGRQGIGKTALLHQFAGMPGDGHVGVYLPVARIQPKDENDWIRALIDAILTTLDALDFTLSSIERPDTTTGETLKDWFQVSFLPSILRVIHRQRRLVFLIDDAEILLQTMMRDALAEDYFAYLNDLRQLQCSVVLTIDIALEDRLEVFNTLIDPAQVMRLDNLTAEQTTDVLHQSHFDVDADSAAAIFKATGGEPRLLMTFVGDLPRDRQVTSADIRATSAKVYTRHKETFLTIWSELQLNERLVLTAIGSLLYEDPLQQVNAAMIEHWLVQTDYALDPTAIHAAIRGLEYRELVRGNTAHHLSIVPGLLQKWMLENARLEGDTSPGNSRAILLIGAIIGLIIIILLVFTLVNTPPDTTSGNIVIPTLITNTP